MDTRKREEKKGQSNGMEWKIKMHMCDKEHRKA
jgi:hypothetical protein